MLLAACGEEPTPVPTVEDTPVLTPSAVVTPSPTATPRPTATPSPTPIPPSIEVPAQTVYKDGLVTVAELITPADGWLAVYRQGQAELGAADLLGVIPIEAGEQHDLTVIIDSSKATSTLQFALHGQGPTVAEFDPIASELLYITTAEVELQLVEPQITVSDQEILDDGRVRIEQVVTETAGWIGIHNRAEDGVGTLLGYVPVQAGSSENLVVTIRWREALPDLTAVLYTDQGEPQNFEFGTADEPMRYAGTPITADFKATLPPTIVVFDQPLVNGQFVVEQVITADPAWLVVYQQGENGQPGFIIGYAALEAGLNQNIVVTVDTVSATDVLLLSLHQDSTVGDEFNFPANDPRLDYQGRANYTSMNTDTGSYLIVRDQPVVDGQITVDLAVAETNAWLVLYADNNGQLGDLLGQSWVPAGFNRDVVIEVDPAVTLPPQLQIRLHTDNGASQTFEPGTDTALLRRSLEIRVPLTVIEE